MPWQKGFKKGLHAHLKAYGKHIEIYEENFDAVRFPAKHNHELFTTYLSTKYAHMGLDLIVTENAPASHLFNNNPTHFKDIPHLFVSPSPKISDLLKTNKKNTILMVKGDLPEALDQLQHIFKPKRIVVIGETKTNIARQLVNEIIQHHTQMEPPIDIQYLLDLPTAQLLKKVSQLPADTVIFYTLIFQNATGKKNVPYKMAERIAKNASVPVFSHWDTLIGSGIAGGYMLSSQEVGKLAGKDIISILNHQPVKNSGQMQKRLKHIYDWGILKRFDISLKHIPNNSILLHKPGSTWEKYRWQIIGGLILLFGIIAASLFWIISLKHQVQVRTEQLNQQKQLAEKQAVIDRLTGLPNRHAMEIFIHEEMLRHHRSAQPLCLMMMDLDHFKQINDTYGHHTGDQVLKLFAHTLEALVRKTDYFARWGGEEFIILLPNTSYSEALEFAERLRLVTEHLKHMELPSFTVSIGVSEYQSDQSFEQWYEQADQLLYQAKEKGRNRICPDQRNT